MSSLSSNTFQHFRMVQASDFGILNIFELRLQVIRQILKLPVAQALGTDEVGCFNDSYCPLGIQGLSTKVD
jgi:hypothetical protein